MLNRAPVRLKTRLQSEGRALQSPRWDHEAQVPSPPTIQAEGSQMAKKEGIVKTPILEDTYHTEDV